LMCNNPHPLELCSKFKALSAEQRFAHCKVNRACFICLGRGHLAKFGRKPKNEKCQTCMSTRHHTLLHVQDETKPKLGPQESKMGSGNPPIRPS
jgi:hypothetical protein